RADPPPAPVGRGRRPRRGHRRPEPLSTDPVVGRDGVPRQADDWWLAQGGRRIAWERPPRPGFGRVRETHLRGGAPEGAFHAPYRPANAKRTHGAHADTTRSGRHVGAIVRRADARVAARTRADGRRPL